MAVRKTTYSMEGTPTIEVISPLEKTLTYPSGLIVHKKYDRLPTDDDVRWLIGLCRILETIQIPSENAKGQNDATAA